MSVAPQDSRRPVTTGDLIRAEREARGWTQVQLAAQMGAAPNEVESLARSVRRWEAGVEPKRAALRRVAAAFQVPVSSILGEDEDDPTVDVTEDLLAQLDAARAEVRITKQALDYAVREWQRALDRRPR